MAQVPGSIQVEIPSWISRGGRFANSFDWLVSQYGGRSSDRLSTVQMRAICDGQAVPQACKATLKHEVSGLNWYISEDEEGDEPLDRDSEKGRHYYGLLDNWMDDEGNVIGFATGVDLLADDILTAREGGCCEVIRDKGGVAQYVLSVDAATIRFTHDNEHPVFQVSPWGEMTEAWEADRFMQARWHPNPTIGAALSSRPPVQLAYSAIAILAGTDTYNWKLIAEPIPAGILNLGPGFNDARARQWKASWDATMQGINPEPLAILYGTPNLDYKAFRPPPRDMAFETTDHWYASLVAACFEMSILDISILTKVATKAAAEEQAEATKRQGLRQLMRKIREAIENNLLEEGLYFIWEDIDPTDERVESEIAGRNADMVVKLVGAKMLTEEQGLDVLKQWQHIPDNVKYDAKAFEERREAMQEQMKPKEEKGDGEEEEQEGEGEQEDEEAEEGEKEKGVAKGGEGSGWHAPPKGTHTAGAKAGKERRFADQKEADEWGNAAKSINPDVTEAENEAIKAYKGEMFTEVNDDLRMAGSSGQMIEVDGKEVYLDETIDAVMKKTKMPESVVTYRGVGYDVFEDDDDLTGDTITDQAFVSASLNKRMAERFSDGAVLEIRVPKGAQALWMEKQWRLSLGSESELLLPRNSKFKVLSDTGVESDTREMVLELVI